MSDGIFDAWRMNERIKKIEKLDELLYENDPEYKKLTDELAELNNTVNFLNDKINTITLKLSDIRKSY